MAEEIRETNPSILAGITELVGEAPADFVSHERFKTLCAGTRAVVRTGECTPYANVILHSGVPF